MATGIALPAWRNNAKSTATQVTDHRLLKRLHSILSLVLAASLLLSGWVGLSPVLHHWLEHGGEGELHTHRHAHAHGWSGKRRDSFDLPLTAIENLFRAAGYGALVLLPEPSSNSPADASDHHHFSLSQLLVGGGVDLAPAVLSLPPAQWTGLTACIAVVARLSELPFDAQSAGRAPPTFRG